MKTVKKKVKVKKPATQQTAAAETRKVDNITKSVDGETGKTETGANKVTLVRKVKVAKPAGGIDAAGKSEAKVPASSATAAAPAPTSGAVGLAKATLPPAKEGVIQQVSSVTAAAAPKPMPPPTTQPSSASPAAPMAATSAFSSEPPKAAALLTKPSMKKPAMPILKKPFDIVALAPLKKSVPVSPVTTAAQTAAPPQPEGLPTNARPTMLVHEGQAVPAPVPKAPPSAEAPSNLYGLGSRSFSAKTSAAVLSPKKSMPKLNPKPSSSLPLRKHPLPPQPLLPSLSSEQPDLPRQLTLPPKQPSAEAGPLVTESPSSASSASLESEKDESQKAARTRRRDTKQQPSPPQLTRAFKDDRESPPGSPPPKPAQTNLQQLPAESAAPTTAQVAPLRRTPPPKASAQTFKLQSQRSRSADSEFKAPPASASSNVSENSDGYVPSAKRPAPQWVASPRSDDDGRPGTRSPTASGPSTASPRYFGQEDELPPRPVETQPRGVRIPSSNSSSDLSTRRRSPPPPPHAKNKKQSATKKRDHTMRGFPGPTRPLSTTEKLGCACSLPPHDRRRCPLCVNLSFDDCPLLPY